MARRKSKNWVRDDGGRKAAGLKASARENPYRMGASAPPLNSVHDFVRAIISDDQALINYALWEARQNTPTLIALFQALAVAPRPAAACREAFQGAWVTQGLWIRDTFGVDELLLDLLRNLLPGYSGSVVILYRGDRWSNHEARSYGVSWTNKRSVAEMFAQGLNRCPVTGGVLLRTEAPASAILAAPNAHSLYLGEHEYVVDRRCLETVEVVERYAAY
jgi:hypothetical protein